MVFRFLQSIFSAAPTEPEKFDKDLMLKAIERVVTGTDPRLRAVSHYRRKLWDSVEHALDFVVKFVNALPPPIVADRQSYLTEPRLRALFASPDHMQEVLSFSEGIRNYRQHHAGPPPAEVYAGLGAVRVEKNVLGIEQDGSMLRRDVSQTVVNFCDHRLVCLTDNEPDTRRRLMRRGFDYLIATALERLIASRLQRTQLEQQQRLLQQKAGLLKTAQLGLESMTGPTTSVQPDFDAIEQQLQELEAELDQLGADAGTIEDHLTSVAATLAEPEQYLRLEPVTLTLDHMNIKTSPDASRVTNTMTFNEIVLGEDRRLVSLFIRLPSQDLLPPPDLLQEASLLLQPIH